MFAQAPLPIPTSGAKAQRITGKPSFSFTIHLIYMIRIIDLVSAQPKDNDLCLVDRNRTEPDSL